MVARGGITAEKDRLKLISRRPWFGFGRNIGGRKISAKASGKIFLPVIFLPTSLGK
jgi:hypothetical protein